MQGAVLLAQRFVQPVQVGVVVLFGEEAGLAVVAALHDVQRDCVYVCAGGGGAWAKMAGSSLALTHFNLRNGNKILRYSVECQQCHHFVKRFDQ